MTTPDEVMYAMRRALVSFDATYNPQTPDERIRSILAAANDLGWRLVPVEATEPEELLPCPFCGGEAKIIETDDGNNVGGSCVECQSCLASSAVEFGFKETLHSRWNRRPAPKVTP